MLQMGDRQGTILEHGTDTSKSGLPLVWITVRLDTGEEGTANVFLASDKGEEKDLTTKRMARATLKLCGFDPDTQEISDLGDAETMLKGNKVPVNISRSKDGQYVNWNIQLPRGIKKEESKSLTAALRAAKSKDEEPMTVSKRAAENNAPQSTTQFSESDIARARAAGVGKDPFEDAPF